MDEFEQDDENQEWIASIIATCEHAQAFKPL